MFDNAGFGYRVYLLLLAFNLTSLGLGRTAGRAPLCRGGGLIGRKAGLGQCTYLRLLLWFGIPLFPAWQFTSSLELSSVSRVS
jgi:hypothetical protein